LFERRSGAVDTVEHLNVSDDDMHWPRSSGTVPTTVPCAKLLSANHNHPPSATIAALAFTGSPIRQLLVSMISLFAVAL